MLRLRIAFVSALLAVAASAALGQTPPPPATALPNASASPSRIRARKLSGAPAQGWSMPFNCYVRTVKFL